METIYCSICKRAINLTELQDFGGSERLLEFVMHTEWPFPCTSCIKEPAMAFSLAKAAYEAGKRHQRYMTGRTLREVLGL